MLLNTLQTKVILIIVPHQDDEINLMGGFLPLLTQNHLSVHVYYVTNGAARYDAELRHQEALQALKILGVPQQNVYFLDLQDGSGPTVPQILVQNLQEHIEFLHPDAIFSTDKDNHNDHIMTSNAVDIVIPRLSYAPAVFKGFAYSTAFEAEKDYYCLNLLSTAEPLSLSPAKVPYIWEHRIRFPIFKTASIIPLKNNILFHAICCHRCQLLRIEAKKIINSDVVFWQTQGGPILQFAKILINNNFAYENYYIFREKYVQIDFFTYGQSDELVFMVNNATFDIHKHQLEIAKYMSHKTISIQLLSKTNSKIIYDFVTIHQLSFCQVLLRKLTWALDHLINYIHYKIDKLFLYPR